jgi:hypothetical protein
MNCATDQGKASLTTTTPLDIIQDYQKKEDSKHIKKDVIPSTQLLQDMLKGTSS